MTRRIFPTLSAVSAVLFVVVVGSYWSFIMISHASSERTDNIKNFPGWFELVVDRLDPAPYGWKIIYSRQSNTHIREYWPRAIPHWQQGYAIVLPHWSLAFLAAILPAIWIWRWRRRRRLALIGHCPSCGYDLRASEGKCPECGVVTEPRWRHFRPAVTVPRVESKEVTRFKSAKGVQDAAD